jgi:hypothetical protein
MMRHVSWHHPLRRFAVHQMQQWQPTDTFDPYNPNQIIREPDNTWGPGMTGGVSSFYFNRQPVTVQNLEGPGLGGSFDFTTLSPGVQMLIVGAIAGVAGFFGMKWLGPKLGFHGKSARTG